MMSELQKQAMSILAEVWTLSPDVRLGQLFAHLGFLGEVHLGRGLGYIDDDELLSILYRHRAELLARLPSSAGSVLQTTGANSPAAKGPSGAAAASVGNP